MILDKCLQSGWTSFPCDFISQTSRHLTNPENQVASDGNNTSSPGAPVSTIWGEASWLPFSIYRYLDFYLCSMSKLKKTAGKSAKGRHSTLLESPLTFLLLETFTICLSLLRSLLVLLHVGDKGFGKHYLKILWFSEFLIMIWFCKNWKCSHFESRIKNTRFWDKLIKISFWKWRLENPLILLPSRIQTWPRIRDKQNTKKWSVSIPNLCFVFESGISENPQYLLQSEHLF